MHFNHNSGNQVITVIQAGNSENRDTKYSCGERRVKEEALCCGEMCGRLGGSGRRAPPTSSGSGPFVQTHVIGPREEQCSPVPVPRAAKIPRNTHLIPGLLSSQVAKVLTLSGPTRARG